jgi:UDP-N-acetylmuramate: L-alanyl-gamma-D-glutamyl-meso-diaminopimelate ligase
MKIHFIAIGGAVMHNLAIALKNKGYSISGSDDEIFEPSYSRLKNQGLLPDTMGWDPDRIGTDLDAVIVGMHARKSNPELKKAQKLGIKIYSFPEYLFEQSENKKRIVIGGSHGKTTITAMVMHVLKEHNKEFDYMVGSQIEGFDTMVRLSEDAPYIILEGDEYLSSPLDKTPKFHQYHPHMTLLSGIAWDHMNVFPTFEIYKKQFNKFLNIATGGGKVFYYDGDPVLGEVVDKSHWSLLKIPYSAHPYRVESGRFVLETKYGTVPLSLFGSHNMQNIMGALLICRDLGIEDHQFYDSVQHFKGAERRQQLLANGNSRAVFLDYAHAPTSVKATIDAFKESCGDQPLVTCLELHTYSSLNKEYLPQYKGALEKADHALVYFNPDVVKRKKLPELTPDEVKHHFDREDLLVYNDSRALVDHLKKLGDNAFVLLIMTSGNFSGIDLQNLANEVVQA